MANPVLIEILRGSRVESVHRGAVCVVDADGATVLSLGDVAQPVFPRSAVKALQALPLVEGGAADHYRLGDEELAIACGSHGGAPAHVAVVERMLARAGLDVAALECGAHRPSHAPSAEALLRVGRAPSALHNNCSGKHAGFLCVARHLGVEHRRYVATSHPVQQAVKATIEELAGVTIEKDQCAVDGCSVPTWAVPLANLAQAFARFGTGGGLSAARANAAARLRAACARHPFFVAGTARFATVAMERLRERAFVKGGAEGVFCCALPDQGLGIAFKCDDGAGRAAEALMAALMIRLMKLDAAERAILDRFARPAMSNWNGVEIGRIRPTAVVRAK
ncbi:MAG: asparaginase [Hyphomicrobiales bacterium]|nr:asparaginase [Hyphomicrobiales bacterium]MBV9428812.1 asparaginase [Bradyrhizobiaceae bacterium]